jgi:hypothetical protein
MAVLVTVTGKGKGVNICAVPSPPHRITCHFHSSGNVLDITGLGLLGVPPNLSPSAHVLPPPPLRILGPSRLSASWMFPCPGLWHPVVAGGPVTARVGTALAFTFGAWLGGGGSWYCYLSARACPPRAPARPLSIVPCSSLPLVCSAAAHGAGSTARGLGPGGLMDYTVGPVLNMDFILCRFDTEEGAYTVHTYGLYSVQTLFGDYVIGRSHGVFPTHECEGAHPLANNGLLEYDLEQHWCSVSRWRPQKVDKRMVLEHTHGLFIT